MELQYSPPKKYQNFFNKIFKKISSEQDKILEEKQKINSKIDFLIENKNFESLSIFIEKNVGFSKNQIEKFLLSDSFFISKDSALINQFIATNQTTIHSVLDDKIRVYPKDYTSLHNHTEITGLAKWIQSYGDKIFENQNIALARSYEKFCEVYNNANQKIRYYSNIVDMEDRKNIEHFTSQIKSSAIDPLQKMHDSVLRQDIESLANRAKILEVSSMGDMISQISQVQINSFSVSQLPDESKNLFAHIKQVALTIESQKSLLDTSKVLDFENLFWKRVPQVLQEYINIPETYRADLAKLANNPESLLKSSLTQIATSLDSLAEGLKVTHIDGMKKTNNYLKSRSI